MATLVSTGSTATSNGSVTSVTVSSASAAVRNRLVLEISWGDAGTATPYVLAAPVGWTPDFNPTSFGNIVTGGYAVFSKIAAGGVESATLNSGSGAGFFSFARITEWSGMAAHDTADTSALITNNTGGASTGVTVPNTGKLARQSSTVFTGLALFSVSGLANEGVAFSGGSWTAGLSNQNEANVVTLTGLKSVSSNTALNAVYTWTSDAGIVGFQAGVVVYSDAIPIAPQDQQGGAVKRFIAPDSPVPNLLTKQLAVIAAPLQPLDTTQPSKSLKTLSSFDPPNLLALHILPLPPFTQENDGARTFWRGIYTDFAPPNLLADKTLPLPPLLPVDTGQALKRVSLTDFLTPIPLLLNSVVAPLIPTDLSQLLKAKPLSGFDPPNLQSLTLVGAVSPLAPIDLSQQVRYRWSATEQIIPNLTLRLPIPPIVPSEWNVRLVARGIYTDFATPNLILSSLAPPPAAPLVPQDHTLRLSAIPLASDFIAPNLTIILPQAPPIPPKVPAGRHRRQADERRRLEVLRAKLQDFEQRKRQTEKTLIQREEGEQQARAKVLQKIKIRKPVEQYAPVANAIVKRVIAQTRHQDIARQLQQIQAEHDQISDAMDEEAALHFMHFLMRLSFDE